mmetsp:Transcript_55308/g.132050  ORF Transcript_55308/g.132050 Transcript_55308/m.132050 type:complete len:230 (+) Transcript_55308:355-1044(+)
MAFFPKFRIWKLQAIRSPHMLFPVFPLANCTSISKALREMHFRSCSERMGCRKRSYSVRPNAMFLTLMGMPLSAALHSIVRRASSFLSSTHTTGMNQKRGLSRAWALAFSLIGEGGEAGETGDKASAGSSSGRSRKPLSSRTSSVKSGRISSSFAWVHFSASWPTSSMPRLVQDADLSMQALTRSNVFFSLYKYRRSFSFPCCQQAYHAVSSSIKTTPKEKTSERSVMT